MGEVLLSLLRQLLIEPGALGRGRRIPTLFPDEDPNAANPRRDPFLADLAGFHRLPRQGPSGNSSHRCDCRTSERSGRVGMATNREAS